MFCSKCGAELPDDARFCAFCGRDQRVVTEEPVQVAVAAGPPAYTAAVAPPEARPHPWLRYWARSIDLCLLLVALAAVGLVRPASFIQNLLALYLFVPVEIILLSAFGTTPGKWLFRISIEADGGGRPGLVAALRRTIGVLVLGMGFLIPIVSLLAQVMAYMRLMETRTTAWDRQSGCRVLHGAISPARVVLILVVLFGSVLMLALLTYTVPAGTDGGTEI